MAQRLKLNWVPHSELSAAHAIRVVATGVDCTDSKTLELLREGVTEINQRLVSSSLDIGVFWKTYVDSIARDLPRNDAVRDSLAQSGCSELQLDQSTKTIANRIGDCRRQFFDRSPKTKRTFRTAFEATARPLGHVRTWVADRDSKIDLGRSTTKILVALEGSRFDGPTDARRRWGLCS